VRVNFTVNNTEGAEVSRQGHPDVKWELKF
jgi:hypothetical protein